MEKIKKQYSLWTGIAMVVGIVIGSGVFFKADDVLIFSNGDLKFSLLAWFVGGIIMIVSGFCFALFANKIEKFNGVIDYVELSTNKKVGYGLAWAMTTFYYPIVASIVALLSARYFFQIFGLNFGLNDYRVYIFAFVVITLIIAMNYFSPLLSSKFQISATIIKLIPIIIIALLGLFASLIVGEDYGIINALKTSADGSGLDPSVAIKLDFGEAVKKTAFAYEGWVCATSINAELKDSKKDLPKALVGGTIAILVFYLIYYISLSAFLGNNGVIEASDDAPIRIFQSIMGGFGSTLFTIFILVSCLGTVNGVSISCCRGMYTMSCRGQGISPKKFSKLGKNGSVSFWSCLFGYVTIVVFLGIWYLACNGISIFKHLGGMDEIICAIIYLAYITIYIYIMRKFEGLNVFKRYIVPGIAILGSLFFTICGSGLFQIITTGNTSSFVDFLVFLGLFIIVMIPSIFFYHKDEGEENKQIVTNI